MSIICMAVDSAFCAPEPSVCALKISCALYQRAVHPLSRPNTARFSRRIVISSKPHVKNTQSSPHHAANCAAASGKLTPFSRSRLSRMPVSEATLRFIFLKYLGRMRIWNSSATCCSCVMRTAPICTISPRIGDGSAFFALYDPGHGWFHSISRIIYCIASNSFMSNSYGITNSADCKQ